MGKILDLTGQTFGRLTVMADAGSNKYQARLWTCRCICGVEKVIPSAALRSGNTRSCGCLNRDSARKNLRRITPKNRPRFTHPGAPQHWLLHLMLKHLARVDPSALDPHRTANTSPPSAYSTSKKR